jgi:ATP/maltotriose-dependent transcriptional regulator MalT
VVCLNHAAFALWTLGYPDQALQRAQEALTLAQELSQPFSLAFALVYASVVHCFRGEGQAAQEQAEAIISLSTEQGFAHLLADGFIHRGWALVRQGQGVEGSAQIRHGLDVYRATGAELSCSWFLAFLAEGCEQTGQTEEGLSALAEALAMVNKNGECWWEAEMYRLKGELLLAQEGKNQKAKVKMYQRQKNGFRRPSPLLAARVPSLWSCGR